MNLKETNGEGAADSAPISKNQLHVNYHWGIRYIYCTCGWVQPYALWTEGRPVEKRGDPKGRDYIAVRAVHNSFGRTVGTIIRCPACGAEALMEG